MTRNALRINLSVGLGMVAFVGDEDRGKAGFRERGFMLSAGARRAKAIRTIAHQLLVAVLSCFPYS